ncbi:MAG TPA: zinc ribbon domain-containing protein, partial [Solirubrobacterales bacterium]
SAREPQPGDRICVNCGDANDPARKFCRRCGTTLVNAQVVGARRLPWWRRLFRRTPKQYAAGERTKSMSAEAGRAAGGGSRIAKVIQALVALLLVASVAGYLALPSFQGMVNSAVSGAVGQITRLVNPKLNPIRPSSVTSSDQLAGHPASQMFDKYSNTDWRASGQQPSANVAFDHRFDLGALIVHAGSADNFTATRRPAKLMLTFSDGTSTTLDLKDDNSPQTITVDKQGIDGFVLTVVATNGPASQPVVISEIEVFEKG